MSAIARAISRRQPRNITGTLTLYHVGAVTVFLGILAVAVLPRFDPDIWWHLYVGRHILSQGVPNRDFLSFTVPGHPWIDHEWLSEVGMYLAYKVGGFKLVLSVFGLVVTGAFLAMFLVMRAKGVSQVLALVLTVVAAAATVASWGPRVQMVSLLLAALFVLILERYRLTSRTRLLLAIVALTWLWSNLHGGFAVGLLIIGAYTVGGAFDRVQGRMTWKQAIQAQRPLLLTLVSATFITLATPNTYHTLLYPLRFLTPNQFTNAIQESQSPNFHLYQMLPFELLLVGLVVCALCIRRRVSWIDVLLCLALTHMALQQTRNVALWCVIVVPVAAVYFQDALAPLGERLRHLNKPLEGSIMKVGNWVVMATIVIAGVSFITKSDSPANVAAAETSTFPTQAISYLDNHPMRGRVFNSYTYGGYLIWTTKARYPVFIDSRADTVYTGAILHDYLTIYNAWSGWRQLLRKFDIRWLFVETHSPIATALLDTQNWHVMYQGSNATIIQYQKGYNKNAQSH